MDFFEEDDPTEVTPYNDLLNESTGIRWLGKNLNKVGNPEYVGTAHYRRMLEVDPEQLSPDTIFCHMERQPLGIFRMYGLYHVAEDLKTFNSRFSRKHQDYAKLLNDYMNSTEYASRNMFIMHRDLFSEYSDFQKRCLDVLLEMAEETDFRSRDRYQKRAIGFIMERMTGFWIYFKTNGGARPSDCEIDEIQEESPYQRERS